MNPGDGIVAYRPVAREISLNEHRAVVAMQ
jgi:hypothetical protein